MGSLGRLSWPANVMPPSLGVSEIVVIVNRWCSGFVLIESSVIWSGIDRGMEASELLLSDSPSDFGIVNIRTWVGMVSANLSSRYLKLSV